MINIFFNFASQENKCTKKNSKSFIGIQETDISILFSDLSLRKENDLN